MNRRLILAAALTCTLTACSPALATQDAVTETTPASHGLLEVNDPGHVTGTITGHCSYRDGGQLPDPRCTPGSVNPQVTQADIGSTICKEGWTETVRPPEAATETFKYDVAYPAYSAPWSERTELDHLVPLELGGSNDATNLWPEYPPSPNPKDKVEDALNAWVCAASGAQAWTRLVAAQNAIASDWMTAEARLGL